MLNVKLSSHRQGFLLMVAGPMGSGKSTLIAKVESFVIGHGGIISQHNQEVPGIEEIVGSLGNLSLLGLRHAVDLLNQEART